MLKRQVREVSNECTEHEISDTDNSILVRRCKATTAVPMIDSVQVDGDHINLYPMDLQYYGGQGFHPFLGNEVVGEVKAVEIDTLLAEPIVFCQTCTYNTSPRDTHLTGRR